MCVPIQRVHRNSAGVLTHVGGSTRGGIPWGLTVAEAVALQESWAYSFFVEMPVGHMVDVLVKTSSAGKKYLTTSPDGVVANNLDVLPDIPNPLASVEPPFPLNIPGTLTTSLMSIVSISYSGNHALTSLGTAPLRPLGLPKEFTLPSEFWTQTPRWLYIQAIVPFPAEIMVFQFGSNLKQISGDDVAQRRSLEAAGKGWWTLEYVLTNPDGTINPKKPTRLTEIKVVIRPASKAWSDQNVYLSLDALSINTNCYIHPPEGNWGSSKQGSSVSFRLSKPAAITTSLPETATLPSVVGLRLDKAFTMLYGAGFKIIYTNAAGSILASELKVDSQDPGPGPNVNLKQAISLTVISAVAQKGIEKIVVSNQSNRGNPMDIWLFDYSTGIWDKEVTVGYQAQKDVVLSDGHTYMLAAVDPTLLNCHTARPDEHSCVAFAPQGNYFGDSNGSVALVEIH